MGNDESIESEIIENIKDLAEKLLEHGIQLKIIWIEKNEELVRVPHLIMLKFPPKIEQEALQEFSKHIASYLNSTTEKTILLAEGISTQVQITDYTKLTSYISHERLAKLIFLARTTTVFIATKIVKEQDVVKSKIINLDPRYMIDAIKGLASFDDELSELKINLENPNMLGEIKNKIFNFFNIKEQI